MSENLKALILDFSAKVDEFKKICVLEQNGIGLETFKKLKQELNESIEQISNEIYKLP